MSRTKLNKYYIEIDTGGEEASGYEDRLPWVCYGTIVSEGNTLEECIDNATVDLIDQDGGERGETEAHKDWMIDMIEKEFMRKYPPPSEARGLSLSGSEGIESEQTAQDNATADALNKENPWNR